jgi:hypothetical protein
MKKISLLLGIGLLCISLSSLAGEVITNDTGEEATGLRVVFSEAVQITAFGDILMHVDHEGPAAEFVFSGGTVSPWGSHWLNWSPATARVVEYGWLTDSAPTLQGLPAEQRAEQPVVTGNLLNPDYFAHPAYVMQGVSERNAVFAMPLDGVEKLAFYPIVAGVSLKEVTWSVEVSHPEGIGASIEDKTLYIWGNNASWAGYGEVLLQAVLGEEVSSVTIPVTVCREDKTLINAEGKKDYFVPWSPELDINRIASVEQHMATYDKPDLGLLDRAVRFSHWRKMEHLNGANLYGWLNQYTHDAYPQESIWMQVDETYRELARIGCDAVYLLRGYYTPERTSPCPIAVFEYWSPGLSMTDEDAAYAINEAHRQGFYVLFAPNIAEAPEGRQWYPDDLDAWFDCYASIVEENAGLAQRTGVEAYSFAHILMPAAFDWPSFSRRYVDYTRVMGEILSRDVRTNYSGPVSFMPGSHEVNQESMKILTLLGQVDIVGVCSNFTEVTTSSNPSVDELARALLAKCQQYFLPLHAQLQKPMFVNEGFTASWDGAVRDFDLSSGPPPGAVYDAEEQVNWYRAWFEVEEQFPFLYGFGWANWGFWPGAGGVGELGFTPRLKLAEIVIAEAYGADDPFSPIYVDGFPSDWAPIDNALADAPSDSRVRSGPDLLGMDAVMDKAYLYIGIHLSPGMQPNHILRIDLDTDCNGQPDMPVGIFSVAPGEYNPTRRWMAILYEQPMKWEIHRGIVDVKTNHDDTFFELRIPVAFLNYIDDFSLRAILVDTKRSMQLDQTDWLHIARVTDH